MTEALFIIGVLIAFAIGLVVCIGTVQHALIRRFERRDAIERALFVRQHVGSGYTEEEAIAAERLARGGRGTEAKG